MGERDSDDGIQRWVKRFTEVIATGTQSNALRDLLKEDPELTKIAIEWIRSHRDKVPAEVFRMAILASRMSPRQDAERTNDILTDNNEELEMVDHPSTSAEPPLTSKDVYYKLGTLDAKTNSIQDKIADTKTDVNSSKRWGIGTTLSTAGLILAVIVFVYTNLNDRVDRVEARLSKEISANKEFLSKEITAVRRSLSEEIAAIKDLLESRAARTYADQAALAGLMSNRGAATGRRPVLRAADP